MRVNVDDIAFMDRRFKLLGGRLGMPWQEALGRCLPIWALAYAKRTAVLPAGDVDALAERQGFAEAMVLTELASEEPEGSVYVCGVNDRIDFLLMQDAKREKAREARLAAAGVISPPGPSRGKKSSPPGPSRGTIPGTGSYSPDPDHPPDAAPDADQIPDPPPARAIPPVVVREQPDQDTGHPEPPIAPPITLPVAWSGPPDHRALAARRKLAAEIRDAVNAARDRVAGELGERALPLLAQDPGEGSLATWILEQPDLEAGKAILLRIVAMAEVEAFAKRGLQWLTLSAIFSPRNATRFAGGTAAEFARKPAKARDMASVIATPDEMAVARKVLEQLSEDSGIPWRVEDGHASLVVDRLRELVRSGVDPYRAGRELQALVTDRGDEWRPDEKMRKNLCPSTCFGDKFAEYLARARKAYGADIASLIAGEQRKARA